jgi:hypothetical protein
MWSTRSFDITFLPEELFDRKPIWHSVLPIPLHSGLLRAYYPSRIWLRHLQYGFVKSVGLFHGPEVPGQIDSVGLSQPLMSPYIISTFICTCFSSCMSRFHQGKDSLLTCEFMIEIRFEKFINPTTGMNMILDCSMEIWESLNPKVVSELLGWYSQGITFIQTPAWFLPVSFYWVPDIIDSRLVLSPFEPLPLMRTPRVKITKLGPHRVFKGRASKIRVFLKGLALEVVDSPLTIPSKLVISSELWTWILTCKIFKSSEWYWRI